MPAPQAAPGSWPPPPAGGPLPYGGPAPQGSWAPYGGAGATTGHNPVCVASLATGILGVLGSFGCIVLGFPLGVVAVVTGIIGVAQLRNQPGEGRAMAIAGICCGVVAIVLPFILFVLPFAFSVY